MRRLLAALLASVMLASTAEARIGIVTPAQLNAHGVDASLVLEPNVALSRDVRLVQEVTNALGGQGNYVLIPYSSMCTEWARTGLVRWPNGTVEQFDGLIFTSYPGAYNTPANANVYPNTRLDSLTRVAKGGLLVPHLYLITNAAGLRSSGGNDYMSSSTAARYCSTGVAVGAVKTNPTIGGLVYMAERPSVRWQFHTYTAGWPLTDADIPVGGIRKLLMSASSGYGIVRDGAGLVESQWPDSLPFYSASNETTLVWDRLWANIASLPNAKTMTFADYYGGGLIPDSLVTAGTVAYRDAENEADLSVLRFALAHFDSLVGGRLFTKGAATRGVFIANANSRGLRRWTGGIAPGDTAAYYASLDSLAAWGVPVTFGLNVNPDTLTTYARDLIKLKSVGSARFTPYITDGVFDTSYASVGATGTTRNKTRWVDPFGRWRDRVFVGSGGIGDTSLVTQLGYMKAACDSVTGRATVGILCPPYDDWSPGVKSATNRFHAKANSRIYADSAMYAMQRAGFIGALVNVQSPECDLSVSGGVGYTNPRGFIGRQGWFKPNLGGSWSTSGGIASFTAGPNADPFLLLGHSGHTMGMGKTQQFLFDDSTTAKANGAWNYLNYTLDRANGSFFTARWRNGDDWKSFASDYHPNFLSSYVNVMLPMDDFQYGVRRGHVLKLFASDLSGNPSNPARTGLHVIRDLQQSFYATNLAAGRTLVRLGYLDEVRP